MNHARTRRLTAGAVAMTLLGGLLTFFVMQPAQANHGSLRLEVTREVSSAPIGTGALDAGVTLTARLMQSNGAPPTAASPAIEVDFELEGVAAAGAGDGAAITPEAPDAECTTIAAAAGSYPECTVTLKSSTVGTGFVRAWIDHDGLNESVELGGTEADQAEFRLADPLTDCATETERTAFTACETADSDGPAAPGSEPQRDDTDKVKITFFNPLAALRLDCDELTLAPFGEAGKVRCVVSDADGLLRAGVPVDAKHMDDGANDPNGTGAGGADADYDDADQKSNEQGVFIVNVSSAASPETGFAGICAWVDGDDGAPDDVPNATPSYVHNDTTKENDGGRCAVVETSAVGGDTAGNATDNFRVKWERRAATSVDVEPEIGGSVVGSNHTLTATVFDQFGAKFSPTAQTVSFEFLGGSPADTDGSTPATPDRLCSTSVANDATLASCSVTYTATASGTDTICGFIGATPSATCDDEAASSDTNTRVDVVTKLWTASTTTTPTTAAPTTTPTTAAPGGGGNADASQGYSLVGEDGSLYAFGSAKNVGDMRGTRLNAPVIGVAYTPGGNGYWLVAKDGGIFSFGDAAFFGSMGDKTLNSPVLGMAATPTGKGYWLFAGDGGIFTFGDAEFFGSMGDQKLNQPVINMEPLASGNGYWLVAADGGIFSFGKADFYGSMGDQKINQPVFDMTSTDTDKGYWLIARDGGVFSFGDAEAKFYGNPVNDTNPKPTRIIGMDSTPNSLGYWIADANGKVWNYGNAQALGDRYLASNPAPMIGFASVPGTKP